ncbi:hypothetical protein BGZ82_003894, partial [Podila clonocystis]
TVQAALTKGDCDASYAVCKLAPIVDCDAVKLLCYVAVALGGTNPFFLFNIISKDEGHNTAQDALLKKLCSLQPLI